MNHRWQQMVMIATSSIIIVLLSYDHLQQQNKLREENALLTTPVNIPDGFLWPDDILRYKEQVEIKLSEVDERTLLLERAKALNISLDSSASVDEWNITLKESESASLIMRVESLRTKMSLHSPYVSKTLQEAPRLWNFSLLGLQGVNVEGLVVMKYELTQASSWFLGHTKTPLLKECPFCAVEVSYEDSMVLADRLSQIMNLTPCYQKTTQLALCDGWRLPTLEEWEKVRGAESQKWEYMIAPRVDSNEPAPTGIHAPNVYGIHDIVGHFSEWEQGKKRLGSSLRTDDGQEGPIGVRFYRAQNIGSP